jgi:HIRAN domain
MDRRSFLTAGAAVTMAPLPTLASAKIEDGTLPLVTSYVAGVAYCAEAKAVAGLRAGQPLTLRRRPDNRFDARTVEVLSGGRRLGTLPGTDARIVASLMDSGLDVRATVREARIDGPRPRITVDLTLEAARDV